jgi:hypothetical protein
MAVSKEFYISLRPLILKLYPPVTQMACSKFDWQKCQCKKPIRSRYQKDKSKAMQGIFISLSCGFDHNLNVPHP